MAGHGVGNIMASCLMPWFLDNFAWRGAARLMAGMSLQLCVCAALYRPVPGLSEMTEKVVETCHGAQQIKASSLISPQMNTARNSYNHRAEEAVKTCHGVQQIEDRSLIYPQRNTDINTHNHRTEETEKAVKSCPRG